MWCNKCSTTVNENICPECGQKTQEDIPVEIYWCDDCCIPVIKEIIAINKKECPLCKSATRYIAQDVRPVFPEERLLLELLEGQPFKYINESVWGGASRYYINGIPKIIPVSVMKKADVDLIRKKLDELKSANSYEYFNSIVEKFIEANKERLDSIKHEAFGFIHKVCEGYSSEQLVISFSGGKDSTVVSDLVTKSLSNASVIHIFGDTTLEFPLTLEYKERFRRNNPKTIIRVAKNKDKDFYNVCEEIGPPSRVMRWCCTMFKTGPISRVMNSLFNNKNVLTFYGIRKFESASRSKYDRVYSEEDIKGDDKRTIKIVKQKVVAPIFNWKDVDLWLYLLAEKVDFNDAYRLGYDRVGCWCCPNNSERSHFLSRIFMPEESRKWREYLIRFAKKIGKPDAEVYIDTGKWKARQGGFGVDAAKDIKIQYTNCTTDENAKVYKINKPFNDEFINMFTPFGIVSKELGRKLIGEILVLNHKTNIPIISIQPYKSQDYEMAVKIQTLNVKSHEDLQRMVGYQIRKYNACKACLGCESACSYRAITVSSDSYRINAIRCVRCMKCVTAKYVRGGCLMYKYLFSVSGNGEE